MSTWNKPLPQPTALSQPFWEGLREHQVRLQHCGGCGGWIFFPRTHCPACGSRELSWKAASGRGTVYTFTVARVPTLPEFTDEMPQVLAVVALEEGPHVNTTLVGVQPGEVRVGLPVRAVFDERPGTAALLRFAPAGSAHPTVMRAEAAATPAETPRSETPAATPQTTLEASKRRIDVKDLEGLRSLVSDTFTDWSNDFLVSQEVINQFAALSGDDYWLHTDPARCRAESPFGTTIAHGALVQVLVSRLKIPLPFEVTGFRNMVNAGSDRIRFATPVPSGCRIHARARVKAVEPTRSGVQMTLEMHTHVVGQDRPSVVNELVILYM